MKKQDGKTKLACTVPTCKQLHTPITGISNSQLLSEVELMALQLNESGSRKLSAFMEKEIVAAINARK